MTNFKNKTVNIKQIDQENFTKKVSTNIMYP